MYAFGLLYNSIKKSLSRKFVCLIKQLLEGETEGTEFTLEAIDRC